MSLRQKIVQLLSSEGKKMSMRDIYTNFPEIKQSTIRGRVYDSLDRGIKRIGKGLYISESAIVEHGDSLQIIDRMLDQGDLFDFIFLDIPYFADGNRGNNRNLFTPDKITPDQFGSFIGKCEKLLKTDTSPICFMFTDGKTSKRQFDNYFSRFSNTGLRQCNFTLSWEKTHAGTGTRMKMGKYVMPAEKMHFFTRSGTFDQDLIPEIGSSLSFQIPVQLRSYPTRKPNSLINKVITMFTRVGDWVFDPFTGSGVTVEECINTDRFCHAIDNSERSIFQFVLPIMEAR